MPNKVPGTIARHRQKSEISCRNKVPGTFLPPRIPCENTVPGTIARPRIPCENTVPGTISLSTISLAIRCLAPDSEVGDRFLPTQHQDQDVGIDQQLLGLEIAFDAQSRLLAASEQCLGPRLKPWLGIPVGLAGKPFAANGSDGHRHSPRANILELDLDDPAPVRLADLGLTELVLRQHHLEEPLLRKRVEDFRVDGVLSHHRDEILQYRIVVALRVPMDEISITGHS